MNIRLCHCALSIKCIFVSAALPRYIIKPRGRLLVSSQGPIDSMRWGCHPMGQAVLGWGGLCVGLGGVGD